MVEQEVIGIWAVDAAFNNAVCRVLALKLLMALVKSSTK